MSEILEVDDETIRRYRENYRIEADCPLLSDRIRDHWQMERQLRNEILDASPDARWETAEQAYTRLYELLAWHDGVSQTIGGIDDYWDWKTIIGTQPRRKIFEIGSGQGKLLRTLADMGHICRGTEITSHRGEKYVAADIDAGRATLTWANTDGVHLDQFEEPGSYDLVLSNQVIEHLHPDDLTTHMLSAHKILVVGGRYIFSTPHRATGPHDLSVVFDREEAEGLHLKEYSWNELRRATLNAGFRRVTAATTIRFAKLGGNSDRSRQIALWTGGPYLTAMRILESLMSMIPSRRTQQRVARKLKQLKVFSDNIFLIAEKG